METAIVNLSNEREEIEMTTNIWNKWWQGYRQSVCAARQRHYSNQLHQELMTLVHNRSDTVQKLVNLQKVKHPGQSESWYLDKVIFELKKEA